MPTLASDQLELFLGGGARGAVSVAPVLLADAWAWMDEDDGEVVADAETRRSEHAEA